ncbi:DUF2423 domain-containing protein [Aspergillus glaucus CBS 516.65]|uniref:DUF2423 domain-containing protein n=1 Tax=Aspergillus glaucus CBS 516.65 TaxID=1160497 RepID=A0A1L9VDF2_ASPGL|nr:hypothetical protein ASPGLDRAFT_50002 [Aspergillus glaucus CBS 516.65]OJJ82001.1 hypothetical protein ASPGLDRAFT_50002 [Aspergillus glaucus CBS 516.65]
MAKSARASVMKRNHAKLRATVFGPVSDARTARLAAKLQDLASQPKPPQDEKMDKEDAIETDKPADAEKPEASEDMDIDRKTGASTKRRSNKSGRIQKREKNSIVFRSSATKAKATRRK